MSELGFDPSKVIARVVPVKKYLLFGKVIAENRFFYDGRKVYVSPKMLAEEKRLAAEEAARIKRLNEDTALATTSEQKGRDEALSLALAAAQTIVPGFDKAVNDAAKEAKKKVRDGEKLIKTGTMLVTEGTEDLTYAQILGSKVTLNPPPTPVK